MMGLVEGEVVMEMYLGQRMEAVGEQPRSVASKEGVSVRTSHWTCQDFELLHT